MTLQLPLENIVDLTLTTSVGGIQKTGYGVCNILTDEDTYGGGVRTRKYASTTEVAVDWSTSSDAYLMAAAIFAQEPAPKTVKISTEDTRVAQVQTIVFSTDIIASNSIACSIDGVALTPTVYGVSNAATLTAFAALIQATDGVSTAVSDGTHTITVTAQNAGIPVVISGVIVTLGASQATAAITTTVESHGIADDITEIVAGDNDWYVLLWNEQTKVYQKACADAIQSLKKQYCTASSDADIIDSVETVDLAYYLKNASLTRSRCFYHTDPTSYPDAALMGRMAVYDPGATAVLGKTLTGIIADSLSTTVIGTLNDKQALYYVSAGGRSIAMEGIRTDGYYFDTVRDRDYVDSYVTENLSLYILNESEAGRKIPFIQAGIDQIEAQLRGILAYLQDTKKVITFEGIAIEDQVIFPKIGNVSAADKAARTLNDCSFTCALQGAIYKFNITGQLTA